MQQEGNFVTVTSEVCGNSLQLLKEEGIERHVSIIWKPFGSDYVRWYDERLRCINDPKALVDTGPNSRIFISNQCLGLSSCLGLPGKTIFRGKVHIKFQSDATGGVRLVHEDGDTDHSFIDQSSFFEFSQKTELKEAFETGSHSMFIL